LNQSYFKQIERTKMKAEIENYILSFSPEIQEKLIKIRTTILQEIPDSEECIKYQIPTFVYHGNLVHFAAYKNHIGFYPGPSGLVAFKELVSKYKNSKGAVQFPLSEEIPFDLIAKITRFRKLENEEAIKNA
jgi:uncharacterized protein YdhG (YjbR/CyaY superfamily)